MWHAVDVILGVANRVLTSLRRLFAFSEDSECYGDVTPIDNENCENARYANAYFASRVPGWKTDRGRIYINSGPPERVDYYSPGPDPEYPKELLPSLVIWRYKHVEGIGEDVAIWFADACACGDYRLIRDHVGTPVISPY